MIVGDGAPIHVLRLRDGFDLGPFVARLDERDFSHRDTGDITIRSHAPDPASDWFMTTDLGIGNIALLPDGATLVLSSQADALDAALMAWRRTRAAGGLEGRAAELARTLEDAATVAIELWPSACLAYDPRATGDAAQDLFESIEALGPLRSWRLMALGTYPAAEGMPAFGRLLLGFSSSDRATLEGELAARERLARAVEAAATSGDAPTRVRLAASDIDGRFVRLHLEPTGGSLAIFRETVFERDLAVAMCG
jgi:hypothetical protein